MCDKIELYTVYTHLIEQHKKEIWTVCWHYCHGDIERCRDMMQDVALVLWTRINLLRDDATPLQMRKWVILNSRSVARNLIRKHKIDTTSITNAMADYLAEDDSNAQVSETLQELIVWLNPDDKRFLNNYLHGYRRNELSAKYNITPNSVSRRMQRIVEKLKKIKDNIYNEPEK